MKTLLMILIILPSILLAGWVKEGNGYISQDSLPGQKRFLPEENAVIVENKDFVLKYDLTTGEIIKRIDIIETDTTYKMAVANDDLSQVYKFYELLNYDHLKHTIKILNSDETIFTNTSRGISHESYANILIIKSDLHYLNNNFILSYDRTDDEHIGFHKNQYLKVIPISTPIDISKITDLRYKFDGYMDYSPYKKTLFFRQNNIEEERHDTKTYYYNNSLGVLYLDDLNFIYLRDNPDLGGKYGNASYGKKNDIVYQSNSITYLLSNIDLSLSKVRIPSFNSFTRNDEMILSIYSNGNVANPTSYIQLTSLLDRITYQDTIHQQLFDIILFDDGQTFYFNSNDRLFKYTPTYLSEDNLHAKMGEISDTLNVSAQFSVDNQSSGSPDSISWYINSTLISNEQILTTSIAEPGINEVKLVVENNLSTDSISKKVYVIDTRNYNDKKIDFNVSLLSSTPIVVELNVTDSLNFEKYIWNMGDGSILYGEKVKYKYLDSDTYSVTLTGIRADGSHAQEIKNEILTSDIVEIDFTKPLFEKFSFNDPYRLYFKPITSLHKVKISVKDKFESLLFENYYPILAKGEIISVIKPVDNVYKIIVELEDGDVYEY